MAFASARYVYKCIMALPTHLADQFRALEYENEVEEGIADASRVAGYESEDWKLVPGVAEPTMLTGTQSKRLMMILPKS